MHEPFGHPDDVTGNSDYEPVVIEPVVERPREPPPADTLEAAVGRLWQTIGAVVVNRHTGRRHRITDVRLEADKHGRRRPTVELDGRTTTHPAQLGRNYRQVIETMQAAGARAEATR